MEKKLYRVVESLYQKPLPIHGDSLEKYDTRIVEMNIQNEAKAEILAQNLRNAVQARNLEDQLQYEVEIYNPKLQNRDLKRVDQIYRVDFYCYVAKVLFSTLVSFRYITCRQKCTSNKKVYINALLINTNLLICRYDRKLVYLP